MVWAITFSGVSPTIFNFVSDLVGVAFRAIFALGVGQAFVYLMSRHLRKGHSIPSQVLGQVPSSFVSSCQFAYLLKLSCPVMALALLLAIGDFAHSIADLGLSFVTVEMEGPSEMILSLKDRNPTRLFELSGDPSSLRTRAQTDSALAGAQNEQGQSRLEARLIQTFLGAMDDIASGVSPLANYSEAAPTELKYYETDVETYFVDDNDTTLSQIGLSLPVDCDRNTMVNISQSLLGSPVDGVIELNAVRNSALVPPCGYSQPRASGIYGNNHQIASVVEHAVIPNPATGAVSTVSPANVTINQGGTFASEITLSLEDQALARDRNDWKKGRAVSNINGIQVGGLSIELDSTVLATGGFGLLYPSRHYFLVSTVRGDCPPLPSGRTIEGEVECLVFTELHLFPVSLVEDYENLITSDFADPSGPAALAFAENAEPQVPRTFKLYTAHIVWGQNFAVDDDLLAVVSAVLTRSQVSSWNEQSEVRDVIQNSVLAAMFAHATVDELPSLQSQVSPQVNLVFIVFLILPVIVTAVIFLTTFRNPNKLPIPTEGWQLMVLGREEASIPKRKEGQQTFPMMSKEFEFAIRKDTSTRQISERLGIYRAPSSKKLDYDGNNNGSGSLREDG